MDHKKIIIVGSGGHSRIVIDIAKKLKFKIQGIVDLNFKLKSNEKIIGSKIIGGIDILKKNKYKTNYIFLAIGDIKLRTKVYEKLKKDYKFVNLIDKNSTISKFAKLGKGLLVSPGAIINAEAVVEDNTIINSNSVIEHETIIRKNCNISPNVTIGGRSIIGQNSFIGLGSNIINNIKIGKNVFVGAGCLVVKDVPDNKKVLGIAAKQFK